MQKNTPFKISVLVLFNSTDFAFWETGMANPPFRCHKSAIVFLLALFISSASVVITVFSFCQSHVRALLCVFFSWINFYHHPVVAKTTHWLLNMLVKVRIHYWFVCLHHSLCSIISNPMVSVDFFSASQGRSGCQTALLSLPSQSHPFFLPSSIVTIITCIRVSICVVIKSFRLQF